jgi:hypothetical protein
MYDQPCHGRSEIHITWIISEHNRPRNQIFTTWKIRDIQRRSFFLIIVIVLQFVSAYGFGQPSHIYEVLHFTSVFVH